MSDNRIKLAFCAALIALFALLCAACWKYATLQLHVAFASGQTQIFSDMRTKALQGNVADAAGCLRYVVDYYPSGTKQETGSRLDGIVEQARTSAVRDIITFLRSKTAENLGTNAEPWIQKYAPN